MARLVACAVVRDEPPVVFLADDLDTLNWVLALKLIARTPGGEVPDGARQPLRDALIEERWGDAVALWMQLHEGAIDVYETHAHHSADDVELAADELQFTPLFTD
jgi:hypothetical protein